MVVEKYIQNSNRQIDKKTYIYFGRNKTKNLKTNDNQVSIELENHISREENKMIQENIQNISDKENEAIEMHKIKQMTVETLQRYLETVEINNCNLRKEGNLKIEELK